MNVVEGPDSAAAESDHHLIEDEDTKVIERRARVIKPKESKSRDVKPDDVDKIRLMAKRNFFETISGIFAEAIKTLESEGKTAEDAEITVNIMDPKSFASSLEEELFNVWAQDTLDGHKISGEKVTFIRKVKSHD